ncbi:MAG: hypothetical protein DI566_04400 [Microbacterium sp.]|nr:MAG: hypothetical protein DI566_04400 [Microbacterium sp.]
MQERTEPSVETHRRREREGAPINDRRLARAIEAGEFVRIAPGSFVRSADWRSLTPIDRHYLRVLEAIDRVQGPVTLMGAAAAAVHGIDQLSPWPDRIDIAAPRRGGGRSTGLIRRHTFSDLDLEVVPWRTHFITTPAQTAIDLARERGFGAGVVAFDQVLWAKRRGGALATTADVHGILAHCRPRRGHPRAERALAFATPLADSVRESESRVLIRMLGFPQPELQKRFVLRQGQIVYTDFWWEAFGHVGEFDGVGKYLDPELLAGRTPEEALLAEKDRGDELRRMTRALSRWRTPDLRDARRLYDILVGDGLPSSRPRPPAGLLLGLS